MIRSKGEAGTGNVVEAVRHMRAILGEIKRLDDDGRGRALRAPPSSTRRRTSWCGSCAEHGRLPVVTFTAGGIATPADAALMMQLGADGVFVGSGIFKSSDPAAMAVGDRQGDDALRRRGRSWPRCRSASATRWPASRSPSSASRACCRRVAGRVGVLALQGAFREHCRALRDVGLDAGRGAAAGATSRGSTGW